MTEIEPARRRGWLDRLAIGILIGAAAISVGAVALLAVYLNRIADAASSLDRVDSLGSYEGRPSPVMINGVNAMNFLLTTTTSDGALDAVLVAHLSASRQHLTLVAVPADLEVSDGAGSLAAIHSRKPVLVVRELERLTGARMDYQVHVDLDGAAHVVDALGGVELAGTTVSGSEAVASLVTTPAQDRPVASANLLRAILVRASYGSAITDPTKFDRLMSALTPCLKVDANLTPDEIQAILVESRVHADEIALTELLATKAKSATKADYPGLAQLREAFASDDFAFAATSVASASGPSPEPTK